MAVVGAFARIAADDVDAVRARLDALDGVETFPLDDPGKVGLVIDADDVDAAQTMLRDEIASQKGVLGVWPVFVHTDPADEDRTVPEES